MATAVVEEYVKAVVVVGVGVTYWNTGGGGKQHVGAVAVVGVTYREETAAVSSWRNPLHILVPRTAEGRILARRPKEAALRWSGGGGGG
jgi:hypothetical protein